jgi:hypothetical protein
MNFKTSIVNKISGAVMEKVQSPERLVASFTKGIRILLLISIGMAIGGLIEAGPNFDMIGILVLSSVGIILTKLTERRLKK